MFIERKGYTDSSRLSLVLMVEFNDSDEVYQLSVASRGSFSDKLHIKYRFDKATEADKDVCDLTQGAHKIVLSHPDKHSLADLLMLPVDKATHSFQLQSTEDSIYITGWSIVHADITASLVYRLDSGVELQFVFSLDNDRGINFMACVYENGNRYLASSLITASDTTSLLLSPKKFLKVCRRYVNSYVRHYRGTGFQLALMG